MAIAAFLPLIGKVIDRVIPDKAKAAEAKLAMMQLEQEGQFKDEENRFNAIIMEAKSQDPWTSRARPSFLYVMYLVILLAIPVAFMGIFFPVEAKQFSDNLAAYLDAIPIYLWQLFGAGYLGYTIKRSGDKKAQLGDTSKSLLEKLF